MVTIQHRIILSPFKRQSTNQYKIVFCVYQIFVWTRSQILMLRSKPFICRAKPDSIVSVRTLLFDSLCNAMVLITEFSSACSLETNPSVYCLEKQNAVFLRSHAFFLFWFLFLSSVFFFYWGGGVFEIQDTLLRIPRVLLIGKLWDYSCLQKCWCLQPLIFTYDNWIRFNQPINFSCSHSPFFMSDYLQLSSLRLLYGNEVTYYLCSC